jgi:hypothetical protein
MQMAELGFLRIGPHCVNFISVMPFVKVISIGIT